MAKFYVNQVFDESLDCDLPRGRNIIGLFKQCSSKGEGNFCGYYAREYYLDTEMYAYYIANFEMIYQPENRVSELYICNPPKKYEKVPVGSHMWTKVIEADSVEEAMKLFKDANWRKWIYPFDEPGMIEISPCKKCGCKPSTEMYRHQGMPDCMTVFKCEECGLYSESPGTDIIKSAEKWNRFMVEIEN